MWLEANGLEPKLSPFDPLALLDEIQRLVPGYAPSESFDRFNLFGGNDVHTEPGNSPGFVPVSALSAAELIVPSHDGLFTSATLGRYCRGLNDIEQHQEREHAAVAAD